MKMKLTDRVLRSNEIELKDHPYDITDINRNSPPAFGVRVQPNGSMAYQLYRRFPGSPHPVRRVIGRFGEIDIDDAREKAREWIAQIKEGVDPAREARLAEEARIKEERDRRANRVETVLTDYLKAKSHLRTIKALSAELRREMKPWFDLPVSDIEKRDVVALIHSIQARGSPGAARSVLDLLTGFFNWTLKQDDYGLAASPCAKIDVERLVGHKVKRERVLDDYEIRALWRASETLGYPNGSYFRLLLLTGLRLAEVTDANWPEINLAAGRWLIPASRMKARPGKERPHLVPITPKIEALLSALPRFADGDFLFSLKGGTKPVSSYAYAKAALDEAMTIELAKEGRAFKAFRTHDIRHTCITRFPEIGVDVGERIVGHVQPEIVGRHNHYSYEREKAAGLVKWHAALEAILEGPADVVELPRSA